MVLLAAAGCGRSEDSSELTVQVLAKPGSVQYRLLEAAVEAFHRQQPAIRVTLAGERSRVEYLVRDIIAGRAADVLEVRAGEVEYLGGRGAVQPLTARYAESRHEFHPWVWELGYVGQQLCALPLSVSPKLLAYNRDAFRRAGLPADRPPRTWDAWVATSKALISGVGGDSARPRYGVALAAQNSEDFGRHFATFVAQLGAPLVSWNGERWSFSSRYQDGARVLELFGELQPYAPVDCVVSDDADALQQFRSGQAAMVIAGPEVLAPAAEDDPEFDIGVAELPAPRGMGYVVNIDARFLAIASGTGERKTQAARAFVEFMAGRRAQKVLAGGIAGVRPVLPVRRDLLQSPAPRLAPFVQALSHPAPVLPWFLWEGKCSRDWITEVHSWMLEDRREVGSIIDLAYVRGDHAISCIYTDIGHPSVTMTLGMSVVALLVFAAIAYAVAHH